MISFLQLFLLIAGYVVGLGAVSVIETLGFFGRTSPYFTQATIRAHRITKPLIWIGTFWVIAVSVWIYASVGQSPLDVTLFRAVHVHSILAIILVANGSWLSFWLSPRLLERERKGKADELLPRAWQWAIIASFFVSFTGWWGSLLLWCALIAL